MLTSPEHRRIHAIIVNWSGGQPALDCVRSLLDQGLDPGNVIFVDNASVDGSYEQAVEQFPDLTIIRNDTNLGYGHANNQGIRLALERDAELVFLVNNDVVVPPGTLDVLLHRLRTDPNLGVVGPRVLYRDEPQRVWAAGGFLTFRQNLTTLLGHDGPDDQRYHHTFLVDFVPGCAMLVRREVLDRVGLLDGEFFAYHEDVDFCLKGFEAGYGIACVGEAAVLHDAHSSTGGGYNPRRKYMMGVNTIWFLRRHGTTGRWLRFLLFDVLSLPPLLIASMFQGRSRAVLAKAKGMFDGLRGRRVTAELIEGSGFLW